VRSSAYPLLKGAAPLVKDLGGEALPSYPFFKGVEEKRREEKIREDKRREDKRREDKRREEKRREREEKIR